MQPDGRRWHERLHNTQATRLPQSLYMSVCVSGSFTVLPETILGTAAAECESFLRRARNADKLPVFIDLRLEKALWATRE
jgi:hypothetical protein